MVYGLVGILIAVVIVLSIKIYSLKRSAKEISKGFADKLQTDTNTLIDISSQDKDMCELADSINKQLVILRKEHLRYVQGDAELKTAITNISHDIRTPLTAIYGYLDMLQKTDDAEKQARYISIIKERAKMMKQLTEELFRYSVILSEEDDIKTETVNIGQALEDSIMGFYGALSEKGIVPNAVITENKIVRNLNKAYLSRVFSNLLNNAMKYSDGDLDITLSDSGVITFSNTAKKLSAVEVEQLFDRFYTVEVARNSTGLGLSIARTLVERMGGTITATYDEGRLIITIIL
ncbi:MAG: HAMP domain-containing histidine kinase [Ruminococcus sp.]|uniref:sensor histidine kinase n=1 Tax=Ruminococcus sp. TaxID=41978 RepID=UPI0025EC56BA|nr:HAMP domain-containing sensor histidine kinase [Ruminococcus sp.]MCR5539572.1 HAMP domain-containing histidine kinase [Ruminococcus sp.]